METPSKLVERQFERKNQSDGFHISREQHETWFLGSLMRERDNRLPKAYNRISTLHNQITHEETNFDERFQLNMRITSQLSEFFPLKWLLEITAVFRKRDIIKLRINSYEDRVCSYLGYIELYLTFRGLTLLDSTLVEINRYLHVNINKNDVRSWKLKLIRIIPGLQEQWIKIRARNHQAAIISTVVHIMNKELVLENCTKEEVFQVKQTTLINARKFIKTDKARYVKKPEVWARAMITKALYQNLPSYPCFPFPNLSLNARKVIENKRWQLDQLLD
ncbi:MAG: hypothetical protein JSW11_08975 [Candidatus Heimdallarchaeota archaeon]|nr:MAG: hypothetical protein JSW11_08975 [Candidatus Heimdallarchaeota archaeon]